MEDDTASASVLRGRFKYKIKCIRVARLQIDVPDAKRFQLINYRKAFFVLLGHIR